MTTGNHKAKEVLVSTVADICLYRIRSQKICLLDNIIHFATSKELVISFFRHCVTNIILWELHADNRLAFIVSLGDDGGQGDFHGFIRCEIQIVLLKVVLVIIFAIRPISGIFLTPVAKSEAHTFCLFLRHVHVRIIYCSSRLIINANCTSHVYNIAFTI